SHPASAEMPPRRPRNSRRRMSPLPCLASPQRARAAHSALLLDAREADKLQDFLKFELPRHSDTDPVVLSDSSSPLPRSGGEGGKRNWTLLAGACIRPEPHRPLALHHLLDYLSLIQNRVRPAGVVLEDQRRIDAEHVIDGRENVAGLHGP